MIILRSLLMALALGAAPAAAGPPTLAEAARFFDLSDAAVARVLAGEIVATPLEASSGKDLSLAVVVRLDAPRDEVYAFVQTDALAQTQTVTLSSGRIDPRDPGAALADLELDAATLASLARDPAGTFQMADSEAARLREAGTSGVLDVYRKVLAERAAAYWERGLPGVLPYAGSGRSPADDLNAAHEATALLSLVPALEPELAAPPAKSRGAAEHQLFWAVQKGRDQAAPVLFHRTLYQDEDGEVFFERRFYSAYDYDALQIAAGVLPLAGGGCVLFYVNRTYTSQVAGFGGSAKRSIGRQLLQQELVAEARRIQQALSR